MSYDKNNIFAKILRGEIPSKKVFESEHVFAFNDINPKAPLHVLVIPKGEYTSSIDFYDRASDQEIVGFYKGLSAVIQTLNLKNSEGFRLISNSGVNSGEEVPHFHVHILAGKFLGPLVAV